MASSLPSTASATSVGKNAPSPSSCLPVSHRHYHSHSKVSFRLSPKPKLGFAAKGLQSSWNWSSIVRAQLNEVVVDGPSNATASPAKAAPAETKDAKPSADPSPLVLASEESIPEFISQVANLVKLVDSRDIMELQLKQLDFELVIRKKEAIPLPTPSAPVVMMHSSPPAVAPTIFQAPLLPAPSAPALSSTPTPPALPPAPKSSKSSLPPLKCPMAGTFYCGPAPGEPPFVKVGDKVQKGQVLCIIEAMKLMNEIEADQSGTIMEIIAEDGKPVSVDAPLFVIEP